MQCSPSRMQVYYEMMLADSTITGLTPFAIVFWQFAVRLLTTPLFQLLAPTTMRLFPPFLAPGAIHTPIVVFALSVCLLPS